MKTDDFFDHYDESSEKNTLKRIIASFCLIVGIFILLQIGINVPPDVQAVNRFGLHINGKGNATYHNISNKNRTRYQIPWDYIPCEDDLGEQVGIVWNWKIHHYKGLNGCKVYSYAKHPEKKTIRIIETPSGYHFFVCDWLDVPVKLGEKSNVLLSAHELPESLESMEIITQNNDFIENIENVDKDLSKSILEIFSGKRNIGEEERGRRYAKLWYDAYGNDNYYYDEEDKIIRLRQEVLDPTNYDRDASEHSAKAHALWNKGSKTFRITSKHGFALTIDYIPAARLFYCENAYYDLSDSDVEKLNQLLEIKY